LVLFETKKKPPSAARGGSYQDLKSDFGQVGDWCARWARLQFTIAVLSHTFRTFPPSVTNMIGSSSWNVKSRINKLFQVPGCRFQTLGGWPL